MHTGITAAAPRSRRRFARRQVACALGALGALLAAAPATVLARGARASSGGAGLSGTGGGAPSTGSGTPTGAGSPTATKLPLTVTVSTNGIALTTSSSGTLGRPLNVSGTASAGDAGDTVLIETAKPATARWTRVTAATIQPGGGFRASWTPTTSAQVAVRAALIPDPVNTATEAQDSSSDGTTNGGDGIPTTATATPTLTTLLTGQLTIPIFKDAIATIYGPGLWGHHTACGERLRKTTLGVANRTLKCGTEVTLHFAGREITVPVIDRGPFANHANWDLTLATAKALGLTETATIGALA